MWENYSTTDLAKKYTYTTTIHISVTYNVFGIIIIMIIFTNSAVNATTTLVVNVV